MYKSLRKKFAKQVAGFERAEDFEWRKWLNKPQLHEHPVDAFIVHMVNTEIFNQWIPKPSFQSHKIDFPEADVLPEIKKAFAKKPKTNAVFFGMGTTDVRKINLKDVESIFGKKSEETKTAGTPPKVREIKWKIVLPQVEDWLSELKPKIYNVELLKSKTFSSEAFKKHSQRILFDTLTSIPKLFNIKILGADNIKLDKIYFLKNVLLNEAELDEHLFPELFIPETFQVDQKYFPAAVEKTPSLTAKTETRSVEIKTREDKTDKPAPAESEKRVKPGTASAKNDKPAQPVVPKIPQPQSSAGADKPASQKPAPPRPAQQKPLSPKPAPPKAEKPAPPALNEIKGENIFNYLYKYQEEGKEFLLKNNFALLADEMGLSKKPQVVSAMRQLFIKKSVTSAIIVSSPLNFGSAELSVSIGNTVGWAGYLQRWAPELNFTVIKGSPKERTSLWKKRSHLYITSYENFISDLDFNLIDSGMIKGIECFIFDEAEVFKKFPNDVKFLKFINPKYIWALTGAAPEKVRADLSAVLLQKHPITASLSRSKAEVAEQMPEVNWQETWIDFSEEQKAEYNSVLAAAKEKVIEFLEKGNPLRFQPNVFTLLHQLKQVCNFSADKEESPKTELLLKQMECINSCRKKVLIFSQYEKMGIKKLEEIFKKNNIKYIAYQPGMSTKEMENAVKTFESTPNIPAMIAGVKAAKLRFNAGEIPYVIHFDQWWNPAFLWQTEDLIKGPGIKKNRENLNVYSYLMKDSIEEKIQKMLYKKGFLNKNIMDSVSAETLAEYISNEEWLEIFDITASFSSDYEKKLEKIKTEFKNFRIDDLNEKARAFLTKLGCRNLSVNKEGLTSYIIHGNCRKNDSDYPVITRIIVQDKVNAEALCKFVQSIREKLRKGKIFIITTGSFESSGTLKGCRDNNLSFINGNDFANYLHQFRIM